MEMAIHAAHGGPAGAEATNRSPLKGTAAKFSGLDGSKPSEQCSPLNQLSDHGVERSPKSRNGTAQLTIFYAGTVNVYDVPADKAKAIMELASGGNNIPNPRTMRDSARFGHHHASPGTPVGPVTEMPAGTFPASPGASYNQRQNIHSDELPLSRKLSLQRFLEKRKERVVAKSACNYAAVKPNPQLSLFSSENKL